MERKKTKKSNKTSYNRKATWIMNKSKAKISTTMNEKEWEKKKTWNKKEERRIYIFVKKK